MLAEALLEQGCEVSCLVRDRDKDRAQELERAGCELHEGDVLKPETLPGALRDADVAYYLVHGMGRGSDDDFMERERKAARNFAHAAEGGGREPGGVPRRPRREPRLGAPQEPPRDRRRY